MQQEVLPELVALNPAPHPEFQGNVNSCIAFGVTSAIEALFARAGNPIQLSPRYLWYYMGQQGVSVQHAIDTINRVGLCEERFCPYIIEDLGIPPDFFAIQSAKQLNIQVSISLIAGEEEMKRALATGNPLVTIRVLGGSIEHCEAVIGYDEDHAQVHGSGNTVYFDQFSAFSQVHKLTVKSLPPTPVPDYIPPDIPEFSFETRILKIPKLYVYPGFPLAGKFEIDAMGVFMDDDYGQVVWNQPDIKDCSCIFNKPANRLTLYKVLVNGTLFENAIFTNSKFRI